MTGLDQLWAGWRTEYISGTKAEPGCVLCRIGESDDIVSHVVWRGSNSYCVLNAYPYTSGHLMVTPLRHVGEIEVLTENETTDLWNGVRLAVMAIKSAYQPEGINVGANLGRAAGAGVPDHLHVHVVPRWSADTNFMTTIADARVLPEPLSSSAERIRDQWPPS